jgi:hypothetical protein
MTDPRIHEKMAEPLREQFGMPLTPVEEEILHAITAGGAILPSIVDRYRDLATRRREHGTDDAIRAEALDAAGDLAAVLQIARSHQPELAVVNDTALKTNQLFATLDQLYDSLVTLTDPQLSDATDIGLTDEDVEALLSLPDVQEYLNPQL